MNPGWPGIFKLIFSVAFGMQLFCLVPKAAADPAQAPSEDEFGKILQTIAMRIQEVAPRRSFQFKSFNDSIEKTAQAAQAMALHESPATVIPLLEEARKNYPDNLFAILLEAVLTESQGNPEKANLLFKEFFAKSKYHTDFEKPFMTLEDLNNLRRTVYLLLRSRGIPVKNLAEEEADMRRLLFILATVASFAACVPLVFWLRRLWLERLKPPGKGYRRCPYCRAIIEELFVECLHCHRKLPPR